MLNKTLNTLEKLVSFDTSNPLKGNKEILEFIIRYLKQFPLNIDLIKSSYLNSNETLYAYTEYNDKPEILFSGHLDVVSVKNQKWNYNPFKLTIEQNKVYGRGTCDMKGFISCVLSNIPYFIDNKLPFSIALTYDEESECKSIKELLGKFNKYQKPKLVLLGEPTEMKINSLHKGAYEIKFCIKGKAAHASNPLNGISSIVIASEIINYVKELEKELKNKETNPIFIPSYTTTNIGVIEGGTAGNIVPENCMFKLDIRPVSETHIDFILDKLSIFNEKLQKETKVSINMETTCNIPFFSNNKIKKKIPFMAATEAGFYQQKGIDAIICGPGSLNQAHKADEFVATEQLEKCCDFLKKIPNQVWDDIN